MVQDESPYVGPTPFRTRDRKRFFGRDREIGELTSLVLAHPITLLVSGSGAGKTSLVNAGLIPGLTGADGGIPRCEVLPIVRFHSGLTSVDIPAAPKNRFVAHTISAFNGELTQASDGEPGSLVEHLKTRKPLLDRIDQPLPRLLIFDQFEELFSLHPQFWEQRLPFIAELLAVADADPLARVLLVMREEYLAQLEQLGAPTFSNELRIRLHLERLDRSKALLAVNGPLPDDISFAPEVAEALVDELRRETYSTADNSEDPVQFLGKYVEPVQLQVVCRALWQSLPPDTMIISDELRQQFGSVDSALEEFFANALTEAVEDQPPNMEGTVRHWVEDTLISARLSRNTVQREDAEARSIPASVLDALVDQHILRQEQRFNSFWFELTHDRLIFPIVTDNAAWFAENPDPLYSIQQQTRQWLREGKQTGYLLTADALADASGFSQEHPELLSRDELEFVRSSEHLQRDLDENDRRRRRSRNLAVVFFGLFIAMGLLTAYAFTLKRQADHERRVNLSRAVASQSMLANSRSQDDLAAILARQAYLFDDNGDVRGDTGTALQASIGAPYFSALLDTPHLWVSSLAFSPNDGEVLASAGGDRSDSTVVLWTYVDGSYRFDELLIDPMNENQSHHSGVTAVAFDQTGDLLASGGGDGFVKLWDADSGDLIERLPGPGGAIRAVATGIGSSGQQVLAAASCGTGGDAAEEYEAGAAQGCDEKAATVRIWVLSNGSAEFVEDFDNLDVDRFDALSISDEGRWLAAGGCGTLFELPSRSCSSGIVLVWDLTEPDSDPMRLEGHQGTVYSVDISSLPDRDTVLASGGEDRTIRIWNLDQQPAEDAPAPVLLGHRQIIQSLAFSPTLPLLAAGDHDAIVGTWEITQDEPVISVLGSSTEWVRSISFNPAGSLLASTAGGGQIRIWNMGQGGVPPGILTGHENYVRSLAFSPQVDPNLLASAAEDGTVRVWTLGLPHLTEEIIPIRDDGSAFNLSSVAFDHSGERILSAGEDGFVRISSRSESGVGWTTEIVNETVLREGILVAIFGPSDDLLFTADSSGEVRVWSSNGGSPAGSLLPGRESGAAALSIALNRDGTLLAVGDRSGLIQLWTLSDGGLIADPHSMLNQGGAVWTLAFGPDDLLVAGGAPDDEGETTKLWNVSTGEIVAELPVLQEEVRSVAFSSDGSQVATGSKDQTLMLWDTRSWESQPTVVQVPEWVRAVAFSPDGGILAAPTNHGGIQTINPDSEGLSEAVCSSVSQNLSRAEWDAFVGQRQDVEYRKTCERLPVSGD